MPYLLYLSLLWLFNFIYDHIVSHAINLSAKLFAKLSVFAAIGCYVLFLFLKLPIQT